jgi:hypothetical protein
MNAITSSHYRRQLSRAIIMGILGMQWAGMGTVFGAGASDETPKRKTPTQATVVRYLSLQNQLFTGSIVSRDTLTYNQTMRA